LLQEQIARLRELLDKDPEDALGWLALGQNLIDLEQADEAVDVLRRAVELKPDHIDSHRDLGLALLESGNPMEAAEVFAHAIGLAEKNQDHQTGRKIHHFLRRAEKYLSQS
jgi:cytochrome c-type biogenesis protein CcmH/NrfG